MGWYEDALKFGPAAVVRGNAVDLPLADDSVDAVITSPPYFALRSYQDEGEHYDGQLGSEPTPEEFIDALLTATREMMRVTKPTGSIFVNLGDKYSTGGVSGPQGSSGLLAKVGYGNRVAGQRPISTKVRTKSLIGVPWRYAIRCIDELGLILRAEIIWDKPNCLPESVYDRVRRSHEQWFHFTLSPQYYSAVDDLREPQDSIGGAVGGRAGYANARGKPGGENVARGFSERALHPLGKSPSSVWRIPSEALNVPEWLGVDHYAAFPSEWPRRFITGWSPREVCTKCGQGRAPVVHRPTTGQDNNPDPTKAIRVNGCNAKAWRAAKEAGGGDRILGYACACTPSAYRRGTPVERTDERETGLIGRTSRGSLGNAPTTGARRDYDFDSWTPAPTRRGVVLDPFGGTGTVSMVARALGRVGVSVDLSHDYSRLARWRINESGGEYRARGIDKPTQRQVEGQSDLLELVEGL